MALSVILVECDVTSPAGVASTLRFSDRAVFPMAPTDANRPNIVWEERLIEPPSLRRSLFDDLQSLEPGLGVGLMSLANADRALDAYQGHVWGEIRVWRWTYGTPFSEARALMTGPAAGTPAFGAASSRPGRVAVTLYDYRMELERPIQSSAYAGTNDGETVFFEGDAGLKGKLKPLAYGDLTDAQIPAIPINHDFQGYQLHDGPIVRPTYSSPAYHILMSDRGADAGFIDGGDLSVFYPLEDFPDFNATSSHVYSYADAGYMKFNGAPVGTITFGFRGDVSNGGYASTPGPILHRLLLRLGVPAERIDDGVADFECDSVIGAFAQEPTSGREFIGWIARSAPLALLPDRMGVWKAVALATPSAEADYTIARDEVLAIEADESVPTGGGEFAVGWGRIWTTYRRDNLLEDVLGTPEEFRLAEPYRYVQVEDAAFKARFLSTWRKVSIDTALRHEDDAQALVETYRDLFGLRPDGRARRPWRVTMEMTDEVLDVELGATVAIAADGVDPDDRFLLLAEEPMRPRRDQIIWTVWG